MKFLDCSAPYRDCQNTFKNKSILCAKKSLGHRNQWAHVLTILACAKYPLKGFLGQICWLCSWDRNSFHAQLKYSWEVFLLLLLLLHIKVILGRIKALTQIKWNSAFCSWRWGLCVLFSSYAQRLDDKMYLKRWDHYYLVPSASTRLSPAMLSTCPLRVGCPGNGHCYRPSLHLGQKESSSVQWNR